MARFTSELLDNDVAPSTAWQKITNALKGGSKSVEVLSRVVDGKDKWEVRYWDGMRKDRSNSAQAAKDKDY